MKRILVVEDDKEFQSLYKKKLESAGFEVYLAGNSNEARVALKNQIIDLIILDILMPGEDGLQLLASVKSNQFLAQVPVLVISNLSKPDLIENTKKMGVVDFLVKSNLSLDDLVVRIKKLLPDQATETFRS